jgi:hypothetical protein
VPFDSSVRHGHRSKGALDDIHRGTFGSVRDLTTAIRAYINGWNNRAHPFD